MRAGKKQFFVLFAFVLPLLVTETGFSRSITLQNAVQMALVNNKEIQDSQASLRIAQLNLERAEKLFGTPQIKVSVDPWQGGYDPGGETFESSAQIQGSATLQFFPGTDIGFSYQGTYDYESGGYRDSYSLELRQSLFQDQSLTSSALELYNAQVAEEKARLALKEQQEQVMLSTVESFFLLQEISNSLGLMGKRVTLASQKLAETTQKKTLGLAGQLDLLKAEIDLAEDSEQSNKLENQLREAQDRFYHSIGAENDTLLLFSAIEKEKLEEKAEELLAKEITEETILAQSELKLAQWSIDERKLQLSKKKEELSPNWSLMVGYGSTEPVAGGQPADQWQAKIGLSYNLFDAGRAELSVKEAEIQLERVERDYEDIKEKTRLRLSSEKSALREALSRLAPWKLKKEEIELRGELVKERFSRGTSSQEELEESQIEAGQVENSYQSALNNLLISYLSYGTSLKIKLDLTEVVGQ